ncbi:MAG: DUF998 domain-containing protein [Chloroflexi bacterium]|nr:MAG: DUF998 domain-containing protein [Chloroflexota bacterium]
MQTVTATEQATIARRRSAHPINTALLRCGVVAGPLFIIVGAIQVLTRPGFDVRYNMLSQMALGDQGWIQVANFVVSGMLVLASAVGIRRALRSGPGSTWGPRLVGVYGVGLIAAAIFGADPGFGFPPGTPSGPPTTMSTHGLLHFVSAAFGFFAVISACFVFARRFAKLGHRGWATYSVFTGVFFLVAFLGTASGSGLVVLTLALWVAIALAWVWVSALAVKLIPA